MKHRRFFALVGLVLFITSMILVGCKTSKPNQHQQTKYGIPVNEY